MTKSQCKERYKPFDYLNDLGLKMSAGVSAIVVSRAGLANISELSYLGKTAIIIPIPDSHQEANARLLAEKNAAVVLNEKELSGEKLSEEIIKLIQDKEKQKVISQNIFNLMPHGAANTIAQLVYKLL